MAIILPFSNDGTKKMECPNVVRKKGSSRWYISIRYHNKQIVKSTGLDATESNKLIAQKIADEKLDKIKNEKFSYVNEFKNSSFQVIKYFSRKERTETVLKPVDVKFVKFSRYVEKKFIKRLKKNQIKSYTSSLNVWFRPYFKDMTFFDITGEVLIEFIENMKKDDGTPLATKTIRNHLTVLTYIWTIATEMYHWQNIISNPIGYVNVIYTFPPIAKRDEEVYLYDEFIKLLDAMDEFYRPHMEMFMLTGVMPSELGGIEKKSVTKDIIEIKKAILGSGEEKDELKNKYRIRNIPKTKSIKRVVETALNMGCENNPYVFQMVDGEKFDSDKFRALIKIVFSNTGIEYKTPYMFRHTFVAWALISGMQPSQLVGLMGHSNKKMVYEIYGQYRYGLINDKEKIYEYYGPDFYIEK